MKVLFPLMAVLSLFSLPVFAHPQWQEAKDYEVVAAEATAKPQVEEFFSFWCSHCYEFEHTVKLLRPRLASKGIAFKRVHVDFMHFTTKKLQDDATTAMMVGQVLGREKEMNKAIFDYLHADHGVIESMQDLQNLFIVHDIDGDKFTKLSSSKQVKQLVAANDRQFQHFNKVIIGTPTVIVNGKYKALFSRDENARQRADLVMWLAKQK